MTLRQATFFMLVARPATAAAPTVAESARQSRTGNLVVGCGFETGNFKGRTDCGDPSAKAAFSSARWDDRGAYYPDAGQSWAAWFSWNGPCSDSPDRLAAD